MQQQQRQRQRQRQQQNLEHDETRWGYTNGGNDLDDNDLMVIAIM